MHPRVNSFLSSAKQIKQYLSIWMLSGTKLLFFPLNPVWTFCSVPTPSASQVSEVKHVISEVGRRLPLCSITWYLLKEPVNKHRCTTCGWGSSLNAILLWWVQFLPPQNTERDGFIQVETAEWRGQWKSSVLELFHSQLVGYCYF